MFKKFLLAAAVMATMASPAMAHGHVDVSFNFVPQQQVAYVAPQPDVVWVPGYWAWGYGRYYWVDGQYVAAQPRAFIAENPWIQHGWRHRHWEGERFANRDDDDRYEGRRDWHEGRRR